MKKLIAIALLLNVPAFAADAPRKVDFTTPVVVDGTPQIDEFRCPLKDGKRGCDTPFTVGELAYFSLERPAQNQSWSDAIKHDDLARAVQDFGRGEGLGVDAAGLLELEGDFERGG